MYCSNFKVGNLTQEEMINILVYCENDEMCNRLGISFEHYDDKDISIAREFFKIGAKKIHPDICKLSGSDKAFSRFFSVYKNMIKGNRELQDDLRGKTSWDIINNLIRLISSSDKNNVVEYINLNKVTTKALKLVAFKLNVVFKSSWKKDKLIQVLLG